MADEDEKDTFRKSLSPAVWVLTILWTLFGWGLVEGFEQAGYVGPINSGFRLAIVIGLFLAALTLVSWRANVAADKKFKGRA